MQITVQSQSTAAFPPERATVHLTVGFEGADKQAALESATRLANELAAAVDDLRHGSEAPVTWAAFLPMGTRSWRPYSDTGQVLPMRHAASAQVKIKFRDFEVLSRFIDVWGAREGITVGWVEWALTEARRVREEDAVLSRAVESAKQRAQTMATAAGAGSVRFLELADPGLLDSGQREVAQMAYSMKARGAMDDSAGGVNLQPEDVELQATVQAKFTTE